MKKLASILVLVFAFSLTTQAQKKRKEKRPQLTIEQHTNLAVKKLTLALDLSEKQQNKIKPLIQAQAAGKKAAMQKMKEFKKSETKPTSDEVYAMQSKRLARTRELLSLCIHHIRPFQPQPTAEPTVSQSARPVSPSEHTRHSSSPRTKDREIVTHGRHMHANLI